MGQGFERGTNEWEVIEQLGDGNLVPQQPLPSTDVKQLKADIDAIKKKLGM